VINSILNQTFKKTITQDIYYLIFLVCNMCNVIMTHLYNMFQQELL